MRLINILFIVIFIFFLFAPITQTVFKFVPVEELNGVIELVEKPTLSIQKVIEGTFQKQVERWFDSFIGFRGYLVKTDNQINFSLFKEITGSKNVKIVLGKDNYLFEKGYIDSLNKKDIISGEKMDAKVQLLQQLQNELNKIGKSFIFIIAPNKASVLQEYIPERYIDKRRLKEKTNYELAIPFLDKYNINYIDAHKYFVENVDKPKQLFFTRGGTHWNYYGACLISSEITQKTEQNLKKNLVNISCDPPTVDNEPFGTDKDLSRLLNIWNENIINGPTIHPYYQNNATGIEFKPDILMVGDSFAWTIAEIMGATEVFNSMDVYYYYNTSFKYPSNIKIDINKKAINWKDNVLNNDIIIVEVNESGLHDIGFGFVDDLLVYLTHENK